MAVGLAFTVLQVATVEATHDPAEIQAARDAEDTQIRTTRETEDTTRQTTRQREDDERLAERLAEDTQLQAARDQDDRDNQAADDAAMAADHGDGTDPCMGLSPEAERDCYANQSDNQVDCADSANAGLAECSGGGDDGVALTIDDERCAVEPEARDHRCPNFVAP